MRGRSRADRVFRLLLRLFPSEFRGDFGDEMSADFGDERADARTAGRLAIVRLWWRTIAGSLKTAPREHLAVLVRDAAYGLRLMRKYPLPTAAAILTIALGVGANTAMFTVVNAVLLQLPFEDPARLVSVLRQDAQGRSAAIPLTQLRTWNERVDAVESLAGYTMSSPVWTGAGAPDRLRLECFSANMFSMLGASPAIGRTFAAREDSPGAPPVVVVSHSFWSDRLGGDPASIGRVLTLDGVPVTVIGVMSKEFDGPRALRRLDGWIPLTSCLESIRSQGRTAGTINVYGRLKRDISPRVAEEQMDGAVDQATSRRDGIRVRLVPLTEQIYGDVKKPLLALLGAAGFVLLIACANVASLLLGRVDARRKELAVRAALGCSRARVVRQLLTESMVFALCGGAAGLLIANWSLGALVSLMPGGIRRIDHIALDGYVLAACLALSTGTALLFGLLPALYASRLDPGAALKESALLTTPSRRRIRGALIISEVALSVALVAGAGLMMKTFLHLRPANPGFEPDGKLMATISLPRPQYADGLSWNAFLGNLLQRLRHRAGVEAIVATSYVPLSGFITGAEVHHVGSDGSTLSVWSPRVTPDYFSEMGIPVLRGRTFTLRDDAGAGAAIVNETMARRMWPGQDPLGRQLVFKSDLGRVSTKTIVGVSRDVRDSGSRLTARPEMYVLFADDPVPVIRIVVKTPFSAKQMAPVIRQEAAAIDPRLPVGDVEPVAEIVARSVATWRFAASLLAAFAGIAATLAAVGLFAVVGGSVTERTPEIGVRIALGAGRGTVLRFFLARGAILTVVGVTCGLALGALTTRFLTAWLVDASPLDRPTFAAAAAMMATVGLSSTYLAARRATRIDPLSALRS
jgi:putative ABC transport system permease protein